MEDNTLKAGWIKINPDGSLTRDYYAGDWRGEPNEFAIKNAIEATGADISPLTALRSLENNMSDSLKKAEKQILDTRANRVNNICFAMLILLYAIGVGIALKYLV
ncbi:hypothetical protein VF04_34960 [Nostoc linckia z7]|uniref:Uncharacterized protein n=1 Tax=Nostoc linckia z7 TaxID=1628745 RepID=A0ABX4KDH9_NOSLI|nr:hypothetical protein [Nostoc linckia]PHJ51480.1 hypothetical protein VF02_37900 [Nostoc linckia z1]PHJ59263.1 hypothetical protein VF05_32235 [Nostoc linckia z3]PHJ63658.1 hypothetical protein VF03_30110 [Nostoc linckia z2]PHJ73880.1 hypothetical protein VF06_35780 [Nostoc linckia z4]PHJ87179.1 hypothetical protein VF04_34960 [Nostoc linckia z7]